MLPLTLANSGKQNTILKIGGNPETKKHIEDLGFVSGAEVTVISSIAGSIIVISKDLHCNKS